jgi:hypothetical protein
MPFGSVRSDIVAFTAQVRTAVAAIERDAGSALVAELRAEVGSYDLENVLLYNFGAGIFRRLASELC